MNKKKIINIAICVVLAVAIAIIFIIRFADKKAEYINIVEI